MSTGKRSEPSGTPKKSKSTSMNGFGRSRITGGPVQPSEELLKAVETLSEKSGHPLPDFSGASPRNKSVRGAYAGPWIPPGIHGHERRFGFPRTVQFPGRGARGFVFHSPADVKLLQSGPSAQ